VSDYVLLFGGGKMPETQEEQDAVMAAWNTWFEEMGDSIKDQGNPFTPAVKSIGPGGTVTGTPGKGPASGYSILRADSLDEAVEKAKGCPVLEGGAHITVYETFEVM
jgi:hypothetical protein